MSQHAITLTVNGRVYKGNVPARLTLVDFLREHLRLTGTHTGCEHGVCGACSILFDGEPVRSCLIFAVQADGATITTVEGLAPDPGGSQRAAGQLLGDACAAMRLLHARHADRGAGAAESQTATRRKRQIRDAIGGNLCRCTGYQQIVEAIKLAAKRLKAPMRRPC